MAETIDDRAALWPALDVRDWAPTKKSLHLAVQMLGKLRVALSPVQPNWLFTALTVTARGVTTGLMPAGGFGLEASLDVVDARLRLERSDGLRAEVALVPARPVAAIYADLRAALATLGVDARISAIPQELPDTTPLDEDRRPAAYDPAAVRRWFAAVASVALAFDRWRAHFFGRSAIALWWGALDLSVMLFSGRKVPAPTDRGYLLRYDLDAELMNAGFYPGDERTPEPFFYGYIYPQPAGCEALAMPPGARWSSELGEWILPYEVVRTAADPAAAVCAFLDAVYAIACDAAGWDRAAHRYDAPPLRR